MDWRSDPIELSYEKFDDRFITRSCQEIVGTASYEDWKPNTWTKVTVSTFAFCFLSVILFGIFILVKYLLVRADVKRKSMIMFYVLTILDLTVRLSILVMMNFLTFFATSSLYLSVIAFMLALFVGSAHT